MFAEVSVVVNGAVDEELILGDDGDFDNLDSLLHDVQQDANDTGLPIDVFVIWHDHELGVDCECAQYLTDHHAYLSFNQNAQY